MKATNLCWCSGRHELRKTPKWMKTRIKNCIHCADYNCHKTFYCLVSVAAWRQKSCRVFKGNETAIIIIRETDKDNKSSMLSKSSNNSSSNSNKTDRQKLHHQQNTPIESNGQTTKMNKCIEQKCNTASRPINSSNWREWGGLIKDNIRFGFFLYTLFVVGFIYFLCL